MSANVPFDLNAKINLTQGISDRELDAVRREITNKYPIDHTEIRNCLLVGRSRAGKSTACGVLKNPVHQPSGMSIFSDTSEPKFQSFLLNNGAQNRKFTLNIIDSPGVEEVKQVGIEARPDKVILDTIKFCVRNEISKLHCLFLFASFNNGINPSDIAAIELFLGHFYHENLKVAVVITRSEEYDDTRKENLVNELKMHVYYSRILAKRNVTVLFMGCVDKDMISNRSMEYLENAYLHVYQMRKKMLEFIFSAEHPVQMNQLPLNRKEIEDCKILIVEIRAILKRFLECRDAELSSVRLDLSTYEQKMKRFTDEYTHLEFDASLNDIFRELRGDIIKVKDSTVFRSNKEFVQRLVKQVFI